MNYRVLDTKEIDYSFLDTMNSNDKKIMGMIFDIVKCQYMYIQKIQIKCNNMYIYIIRDNKHNRLVHDLRSDCLRFSNSKNIDRWIDINDFLEAKIIF